MQEINTDLNIKGNVTIIGETESNKIIVTDKTNQDILLGNGDTIPISDIASQAVLASKTNDGLESKTDYLFEHSPKIIHIDAEALSPNATNYLILKDTIWYNYIMNDSLYKSSGFEITGPIKTSKITFNKTIDSNLLNLFTNGNEEFISDELTFIFDDYETYTIDLSDYYIGNSSGVFDIEYDTFKVTFKVINESGTLNLILTYAGYIKNTDIPDIEKITNDVAAVTNNFTTLKTVVENNEAAIEVLQNKDVFISKYDYAALTSVDNNKIYYITEL